MKLLQYILMSLYLNPVLEPKCHLKPFKAFGPSTFSLSDYFIPLRPFTSSNFINLGLPIFAFQTVHFLISEPFTFAFRRLLDRSV